MRVDGFQSNLIPAHFDNRPCHLTGLSVLAAGQCSAVGYIDEAVAEQGSGMLAAFMTDAELIAQICLLRGLVSGLPDPVWLERLSLQPAVGPSSTESPAMPPIHSEQLAATQGAAASLGDGQQQQQQQQWCLLTQGVLPLACQLARKASDMHTQFHAQVLVSSCLLQMLSCRQVPSDKMACCLPLPFLADLCAVVSPRKRCLLGSLVVWHISSFGHRISPIWGFPVLGLVIPLWGGSYFGKFSSCFAISAFLDSHHPK